MGKLIWAASVCLLCASAAAADTDQVIVNGVRNPELRTYRAVSAGLDAFDEYHRLAPLVPQARFRMLPRKKDSAAPAEPLALRIVGDGAAIAVPIDADGGFTVPRSQAAYDSDADLVLNQKKGLYRGDAEVRTPGLPEHVRRMGDLRLECRVKVAIGKAEAPLWVRAFGTSILLTSDWCSKGGMGFGYNASYKIASATLTDGERKLALKVANWGYDVPIGDTSWPDDALIELSAADG